MKTIGLIGGMSWESTVPYYRRVNEVVKERLGGLHSARVVLYSVDFYEIEQLQHAGKWDEAGRLLANAAKSLESAGADFLVLCTTRCTRLWTQSRRQSVFHFSISPIPRPMKFDEPAFPGSDFWERDSRWSRSSIAAGWKIGTGLRC